MANCNFATVLASRRQLIGVWSRELQIIRIGILCNLKNLLESGTPMPACNFSTLVSENKQLIGVWKGELDVIEIGLLCDIGVSLGGILPGGAPGGSGIVFTTAAGTPPTDGSITTQGYIDSNTSIKYINVAWTDVANPQWEQF